MHSIEENAGNQARVSAISLGKVVKMIKTIVFSVFNRLRRGLPDQL